MLILVMTCDEGKERKDKNDDKSIPSTSLPQTKNHNMIMHISSQLQKKKAAKKIVQKTTTPEEAIE